MEYRSLLFDCFILTTLASDTATRIFVQKEQTATFPDTGCSKVRTFDFMLAASKGIFANES